ncbi:MAG: tetratricopeptide repeat protein, partial [Bacteroidota bacterium]
MKHILLRTLFLIISVAWALPSQSQQPDTLLASIFVQMARQLGDSSRYDSAEVYWKKALNLYNRSGKVQRSASCLVEMGNMYVNQDRHLEALEVLSEAHQKAYQSFGEVHPLVAKAMTLEGLAKFKAGQAEEGARLMYDGLAIRQKLYGESHTELADSYFYLSKGMVAAGNYEQALSWAFRAHEEAQTAQNETPVKVQIAITGHLASLLSDQYRLHESLQYLQPSLQNSRAVLGRYHPQTVQLVLLAAHTLQKMQALQQASLLLKVELATVSGTHAHINLLDAYAHNFYVMGRYEEASVEYKRLIALLESAEKKDYLKLANSYTNLGECLLKWGKYPQAISALEKARDQEIIAFMGQPSPTTVRTMHLLSHALQQQGEGGRAAAMAQQAVSMSDRLGKIYLKLQIASRGLLAQTYCEQKKYVRSLDAYQEALGLCSRDFSSEDPYANPSPESLLFLEPGISLLIGKGNVLLAVYQNLSKSPMELAAAEESFKTAIALLSQETGLNLGDRSTKMLRQACEGIITVIGINFQKQQDPALAQQAFYFADLSRSYHVPTFALHQAKGLPDSILNQEKILAGKRKFYQDLINSAQADSAQLAAWQAVYDSTLEQHQLFKQTIYESYPAFGNTYYRLQVADVLEVQFGLDAEQVIFNTFLTENNFYVISLDQEGARMFISEVDTNFDYHLQQLHTQLGRASKSGASQVRSFGQSAYFLYQVLMEKALNQYASTKSISVIPDLALRRFPFEVLISSPVDPVEDDFRNLFYLLHTHQINYAFSLRYYQESRQLRFAANKSYLGWNTQYSPRSFSNYPLMQFYPDLKLVQTASRGFQEEIRQGRKIWDGERVNITSDNLSRFVKLEETYGVIQLGVQCLIDESSPLESMMFLGGMNLKPEAYLENLVGKYSALQVKNTGLPKTKDHHFNIKAISSFEWPSQLVLITDVHRNFSGAKDFSEGLPLLADALYQSGAAALTVGLWQPREETNLELNRQYMRYLRQGLAKDQALQLARRSFLNEVEPEFAHPHYWGHMMLIGNPNALDI